MAGRHGLKDIARLCLALCSVLLGCQAGSGNFRERLGIASRQAAGAPQIGATTQESGSLISSGMALEREGRFNEAIQAYQAIVRQQPDCAEAHHGLAVCYCKKGQLQFAADHYQAALRLAPNDADVLCDFGYFHYLHGDLAQAESLLRRALQLDPEMPRAHANLGLVLARRGKQQEAIHAFVHSGCPPAEAHANVAYALLWDNELDQAERCFQTALRIEPSCSVAATGLVQLQSRRGLQGVTRHAETTPRPSHWKEEQDVTRAVAQLQSDEFGSSQATRR